MKTHILNITKLLIFLLLTIYLITYLGKVFMPKYWHDDLQGAIYSVKGFYEIPNNTLDVVFVGTSSINRSISPMQIYDREGITSFNYSAPSARVYTIYYFIKDILQYQKPKVIFVDTCTFFYEDKESEPLRRKSFDFMKMSKVKKEMIDDKIFENTFLDKISYYFPLFRFHTRWNELKIKDISDAHKRFYSINKGSLISEKLNPNNKEYSYMKPTGKIVKMQSYSLEYFYKIIDLCDKNNIDLVFLGMPDAIVWNYESSKEMEKLVENTTAKFIDINDKNNVEINWHEDTEDNGWHLNAIGTSKVTNFITDYLVQNYEFENHKNDKKYSKWNDDLEKYIKIEKNAIESIKTKIKQNEKLSKK